MLEKENNVHAKKHINSKRYKYIFLFISLISLTCLFIFYISQKNHHTSSNPTPEKRHLLETANKPNIISYQTPNKVNTILDHLFYPYHSDIIRNMDDYEFIRDSLGKINMRLLFNSNIHGDYAQDIHAKTSNYHHLIVLIETVKGNRFGGYTSNNFNPEALGLTSTSIDVIKSDHTAFLFNLDKKKIYDVKNEKKDQALECDDYYVLSFGGSDLLIKDNFLNEGGSSHFPDYFGQGAAQNELTNGEKFFEVKSFELFQVLFYSEFGDEKNKMGEFKTFIK